MKKIQRTDTILILTIIIFGLIDRLIIENELNFSAFKLIQIYQSKSQKFNPEMLAQFLLRINIKYL